MVFSFESYLKSRLAAVEGALKRCVPAARPKRLADAMRYSLMAGGKRLRPLLVIASAEACGARASEVLGAACAFECLHTYSLIHDDLPAMDDDDLRRGRPTSHKAFDEATAILAGDALQALAFELLASSMRRAGPARALEALRVFAQASGQRGMVGGQMADIEAEGRPTTAAQLRFIHAGKTGALIGAAIECGAVLAGASALQRRALKAFGRHIGLAFQVSDDILNVVGDEAKLGKKTGSDAGRGKATYPSLFGLERSRKIARAEWARAQACLKAFGGKGEPLAALARFVIERDH
jgi:geranylgeranyl diphosphate synthase type II